MANDVVKVAKFVETIEAFMVNDIQVAISGKANFLAALGLLDYTEILGGLVTGNLLQGPKSENFAAFLPYLDHCYEPSKTKPYQDLNLTLAGKGIYGKVRSGLVHQYLLNQRGQIRMTERTSDVCGISIDSIGAITFVVKRYFRDFKCGIAKYKLGLFNKKDRYLIAAIGQIPMGNI